MTQFDEYEKTRDMFESFFTTLNSSIADVPQPLLDSMRYALKGGGKRVRPVILIEAARLFGLSPCPAVMNFAAAIETLHNYTLVHDDLPSMDNDDYRRGRLTVHRVFGDDVALLAGDALLNRAYELVLLAVSSAPDTTAALSAARLFAELNGASGLIGGQTADILVSAESGRDEDTLNYIYRHKTGDLIAAAALCGAMLAGADEAKLRPLSAFAYAFSYAFQLNDDLLDAERPSRGASALDLYDRPSIQNMVYNYTEFALNSLNEIDGDTTFFKALAQAYLKRTE